MLHHSESEATIKIPFKILLFSLKFGDHDVPFVEAVNYRDLWNKNQIKQKELKGSFSEIGAFKSFFLFYSDFI